MDIFNKKDILDPTFKKWEPLLPEDNKQNLNAHINRVEHDILLNGNPSKNSNQHFNKLFPAKKQLVQFNLTDENNRFNVMSQELMEKDEKIQELKHELLKIQMDVNDNEKERNIYESKLAENDLLKQKLNEQYNISKEIPEYRYQIKKHLLEKKSDKETIQILKNIIHKQQMVILDNTEQLNYYRSSSMNQQTSTIHRQPQPQPHINQRKPRNIPMKQKMPVKKENKVVERIEEVITDEEESSSEEETSEEEEEGEEDESIYKNEKLKTILLNHDFDEKDISDLFIEMRITEKAKISKELISTIINYLQN